MRGRLTRRQLLAAFALTGSSAARLMARPALVQPGASVPRARTLNHVSIAVSDLARSAAFYQRIFGLPAPRTIGSDSYALDFNGHFVGLDAQAKGGRINHFCIGVDGFQPRRDAQTVRAGGFDVIGSSDGYVDVRDPDGIRVRISETKYSPLLRARTLNHVNFSVSNLQRSAAF